MNEHCILYEDDNLSHLQEEDFLKAMVEQEGWPTDDPEYLQWMEDQEELALQKQLEQEMLSYMEREAENEPDKESL